MDGPSSETVNIFLKNSDLLGSQRVKGALSQIFSISLSSQNTYLHSEKPTNNGSFLLTTIAIAILVY